MQAFHYQTIDYMLIFSHFVMNRNDCSTFQLPKIQRCNCVLTILHLALELDYVPVTKIVYPLWKKMEFHIFTWCFRHMTQFERKYSEENSQNNKSKSTVTVCKKNPSVLQSKCCNGCVPLILLCLL